jgi:NAD(P)-dependent dehydrogenase (short-subunit alcohol dehydrogenase family)
MRPPAIPLETAHVAITGAARGIGRATAEAFAARGARVSIADLDAGQAGEAAAAIGPLARGFAVDVGSRDSFGAFVAAAEEGAGPIDVLVNNAGVMPLGRFLDEPDATSRTTLDVNLWGVIHGMQLVLPGMVERRRGHVVNVASMMGKLPVPGAAVYAASKHAVVGLTASVREELAGTGVTVTAVLPTATRTGLVSGVPLGRGMPTAEAEDVARAVVASCRTRPAELTVPRWLAGYEPLAALTPRPLMRLVRRLLASDRVLTSLDAEARAGYDAGVTRQRRG